MSQQPETTTNWGSGFSDIFGKLVDAGSAMYTSREQRKASENVGYAIEYPAGAMPASQQSIGYLGAYDNTQKMMIFGGVGLLAVLVTIKVLRG